MNLSWIKKVYLYLVSLVSLIILIIAGIMILNIGLKAWIFTKADDASYYAPKIVCTELKNPDGSIAPKDPNCSNPNYEQQQREEEMTRRAAQRQSDAAHAIAMIIIGAPVFYYHWKLARKES
ncbi:MAG TPA: hypothetical protein VHQ41_02405 [Patescibacteria group bacterium]|jgi:hypothetical protein|nr:hypothetical protein [Patescibacteria group bacterium]